MRSKGRRTWARKSGRDTLAGAAVSLAVLLLAAPASAQSVEDEAGAVEGNAAPSSSLSNRKSDDGRTPAASDKSAKVGVQQESENDADETSEIWADHEDVTLEIARGTFGICETITIPITYVPIAGAIAASLIEWACLAPAIVGVDHVESFHGTRKTEGLQSGTALALMKATRDVVRLSGWTFAVGLGAGGFALLSPIFVAVPVLAPAFFLVFVGSVGVTYGLLSFVQNTVSEWIFSGTFGVLTDELDEESRAEVRKSAVMQLPLTASSQYWRNMVLVAGVEPPLSWTHFVPVYGSWATAQDRATALKGRLKRFSQDDNVAVTGDVETLIDGFAVYDGVVGGIGQLALVGGAGLYLAAHNFFLSPDGREVQIFNDSPFAYVGAGLLGFGGLMLAAQYVSGLLQLVWIPSAVAASPTPAATLEE